MRIGYARVSTDEQSLDLQLDALKIAGYRRVFTDNASAVKGDQPGLAEAESHLRTSDVLVVWKLDSLGAHREGAGRVRARSAGPRGPVPQSDRRHRHDDPGGLVLLPRHGVAGLDGAGTAGRTHTGRARRRASARSGGWTQTTDDPGEGGSGPEALQGEGMSPRDVAMSLGVSVPTLYRWSPATSL